MATRLMYNSAADTIITRPQLNKLKTPPPMGSRHAPYGFGEFAGEISAALKLEGIDILGQEYAIRKDANQMFGLMEIGVSGTEASDFNLMLGMRGSHDQSIPRGITLGSQVIVCSNLCFSGNLLTMKTKQTTNIADRIPAMVREAIAQIPEMANKQKSRYDAFRNVEISHADGDKALVDMYRKGGLGVSNLTKAISEWDAPSHEEHAEQGYSAWRLFNACTESLKPSGNRGNMQTVEHHSSVIDNYIANEIVHFS